MKYVLYSYHQGLTIFFVVLMTIAIYEISVQFKGLYRFKNSNAVVFMVFLQHQ